MLFTTDSVIGRGSGQEARAAGVTAPLDVDGRSRGHFTTQVICCCSLTKDFAKLHRWVVLILDSSE